MACWNRNGNDLSFHSKMFLIHSSLSKKSAPSNLLYIYFQSHQDTKFSWKKASPLICQTEGNPNEQDAEKQLTGWLERWRVRMETRNLELELICWRRCSREWDFPPQHSTVYIMRTCSNDCDTHTRVREHSVSCETFLRKVYTLRDPGTSAALVLPIVLLHFVLGSARKKIFEK